MQRSWFWSEYSSGSMDDAPALPTILLPVAASGTVDRTAGTEPDLIGRRHAQALVKDGVPSQRHRSRAHEPNVPQPSVWDRIAPFSCGPVESPKHGPAVVCWSLVQCSGESAVRKVADAISAMEQPLSPRAMLLAFAVQCGRQS
jgi:hypothetical protein